MSSYLQQALELSATNLTVESRTKLELFVSELLRWNKKINLTAITDQKEIAVKHIIDSLLVSDLISQGWHLLDIGSGAGFPGIPLAITRSDLEIVSVDSVAKKIQFQKHVARLLALDNFTPVHTRIEGLDHTRKFDVIISRAFARLDSFAELAKPFMKCTGKILAMKGPGAFDEIADSAKTLASLNLAVTEKKLYELPFDSGERAAIILKNTC